MRYSARCSRRRAAVLMIAMLLLGGCARVGSEARAIGICPLVVAYSAADQARAALEVDAMAEDAIVVRMLSDYAVLREQMRVC